MTDLSFEAASQEQSQDGDSQNGDEDNRSLSIRDDTNRLVNDSVRFAKERNICWRAVDAVGGMGGC